MFLNKADALKIANYALNNWLELREYIPAEDMHKTLKVLNRQYLHYNIILVMQKNSLIALLDTCFPNANTLFSSPRRVSDGHEKRVDFVLKFHHISSVAKLSLSTFKTKYQSWTIITTVNQKLKEFTLIGLYLFHTIFVIVVNCQRVDYGYKYIRIMKCICNRFIICACILHNDLGFAAQELQSLYELLNS